jgi:YhcH/YjgK/YiaL family protein
MHPHFIDVLKFMDPEPCAGLPDDKYEVNEQGTFAIIETYETKEVSDCFIECHRKYIDVQVVIEGMERVAVCHRSACDESPYDEEKDFQKLKGDVDFITLEAGSFMIFYPDDAHMPKVKHGESSVTVKKVVFKVPLSMNNDKTDKIQTVEVDDLPIELYKIMKIANIVGSGGEAKIMISEGFVSVNDEVETRKRKKIYAGDIIAFENDKIQIAARNEE